MHKALRHTIIACMASLTGVASVSCGGKSETPVEPQQVDTIAVSQPTMYGLPIDSFTIETYSVGRNERLTNLLGKTDLSVASILALDKKAKPIFSFNSLRAGNTYALFFSPDTVRTLKHFVYEVNPTTYVTCSFADSVTVRLTKREIYTKEVSAGAVITSNLWNATKDNGMPPMLSAELSDIFAWTVDFFGIENGDYFKVIYDERYTDTTFLGVDKIKAALFMHRGTSYYAFRYDKDSTMMGFYDLQGNSLRKAFLKAPLKYSRISSRFSNGRMHPVLRIRRPHHGVDYAAPAGTPVYTIGDGKIIAKGWDGKGGGNYVKVRHNSVYTTVYMHLRGFAKGLNKGQTVRQGDLLGYVGSTGLATGPHLDFRVYMNDRPIDPLNMEVPPAQPIDNDEIQSFINLSDSIRPILDAIKAE